MTIKICFNNQTHRISQNPVDFTSLIQKVIEIFGNQLPQNWTLQYLDSDNDKIMLNSQEDYKTLLEEEIGSSSKSVKIFVFPLDGNERNVDLSAMLESEKKENVEEKLVAVVEDAENTYILEAKDLVQEIKNEEIPQVQEEKVEVEPVVEEKVVIEQQPEPEPVVEEQPQVQIVQDPTQIEQEVKEKLLMQKVCENYLRNKDMIAAKREMVQAKIANKLPHHQLLTSQERKERFRERIAEKQAQKKTELKDLITDILYEQLPIIASLTKEFIQDDKISTEPRKRQVPVKAEPQPENLPVHKHVRCDGCGVYPIVGIRYKCHTCHNFDYCEKCEATQEHNHPFIKFKKPHGQFDLHSYPEGPALRRKVEARILPAGPLKFVHCIKKINEQIKPQVVEVKPEEAVQPVIEKAEVVIEENKPVIKKAEVVIEEIKPEEIKKEEEIKVEEIKKEEEIVQENKKEYDAKTREKAEKLKEMFGDLDLQNVLEFVSQVPDLSLEELIDCYKQF